ncbi:MAG TPA: lysophospholipid acyltransferase family protein [Candidatus Krumholzibacteria bacterium]|nr:lysophospholipid acyltransferase family protein [Candidatus Krumholzibacteria bacterium]HPD71475.1 lysophospholipid acyltransferase family protein [Candidatus Krumholzibacteria bacterium]HRY41592.1 lysophospholipid acyltransferase family protein [Candidatus Krumholzibacteria bacterium]
MRRLAKRVVQWRDYLLLATVFALARPLPFRALQRLGRRLGLVCWTVAPFRRGVVLANLRAAFGAQLDEPAIRALGRESFAQLGTTLLEFCGYWRLSPERIRGLVEVEGREHIEAALHRGGGALLVSGHFGNWELLGAWLATQGRAVKFLVKTQSNERVDRLQNDVRRRAGVGIIRAGPSVKDVVRTLRGGGLVGLLGDQDAGAGGVFVDFLGRPASVFRGTASLAWRLRCPIVTGFLVRRPDGGFRATIGAPLRIDPAWDEETAIRAITELHTQRLEAMVRSHPDHYFWVHRRWKTRPPEETA